MISFNQNFGELGIEVAHYMPDDGSGVYVKGVFIQAGKKLTNHSHSFTHKSILAFGTVMVKVGDADPIVYPGPDVLLIERGAQHEVTAVTDAYWFCVHATDECDPEKIDQVLTQ